MTAFSVKRVKEIPSNPQTSTIYISKSLKSPVHVDMTFFGEDLNDIRKVKDIRDSPVVINDILDAWVPKSVTPVKPPEEIKLLELTSLSDDTYQSPLDRIVCLEDFSIEGPVSGRKIPKCRVHDLHWSVDSTGKVESGVLIPDEGSEYSIIQLSPSISDIDRAKTTIGRPFRVQVQFETSVYTDVPDFTPYVELYIGEGFMNFVRISKNNQLPVGYLEIVGNDFTESIPFWENGSFILEFHIYPVSQKLKLQSLTKEDDVLYSTEYITSNFAPVPLNWGSTDLRTHRSLKVKHISIVTL